jgi:hypothetical protein
MPEATPPRAPRSHTATAQWQSFEVRMRRRRVERCILRAEVALEAGFPGDARLALAEARQLDPLEPLDELDARIEAATAAAPAPPSPRRWLLGLAAALVLAVLSALMLIPSPSTQQAIAPVEPQGDTPAPARPPAVAISEQLVTPEVVTGEPDAPAARSASATPPDMPAQPSPPQPTPAAPPTALPPPAVHAAPMPVRATGAATLASAAPVPVEPLALGTTGVTPPPAPAEVPTPAADPAVESVSRIRSVLSQYEAAYTGLDAAAARAVWPGVNERALARAFNNLESQRISLDQCDVSVDGASARAECRGLASWVPKVGGGGRTEARRWTFDLRQAGGGWQIVRAEAR